ncbi:11576_t:CDS:2, partial [Racocetra fulgida]
GYTARIGQLLEALQEVDSELENVDIDSPFSSQLSGELIITFDQVSISSPSGHQLLSDFKFFIEQEKNLMIIGPNGSALDESSSSLDSYIESQIFETCKDLGITTITVSHNKNLLKYHDKVLLLDGKGGYSTSDIDINGCEDVWSPNLKLHPPYPCEGGYYREESIMLLRKFFVRENENVPKKK